MKGEVVVVGVGCTPFGEHFDRSYNDLVADACFEAFKDAGIAPRDVGAAYLGTAFPDVTVYKGRSGLDLHEAVGLRDIPITRVSNFCATGADALRNAAMTLLAGRADVALAVGVEKQRDRPPKESIVRLMTHTGHPIYQKGFTAAGTFAVFANRYAHVYGLKPEDLADVSVKNHRQAASNPKAHHRKPVTREQVLASMMVAAPLRLLDCCPATDGAAAAIVVRREDAARFTRPVPILGAGFSVSGGWDAPFFDPDFDFLGFPGVRKAAQMAYAESGAGPGDVDFAEVHDCFTVCELLAYEDLGFCARGEAVKFLRDGKLPVNLSGGLLSCGHPVGATGLRMIYEIASRLRADPTLRRGLAQNFGGPGSVASVMILGKK